MTATQGAEVEGQEPKDCLGYVVSSRLHRQLSETLSQNWKKEKV